MIFANLLFIYLFLPLNLLFYFISKNEAYRNGVLICFSFLFYAWGEPVWFTLLLSSAAFDYMHGRVIERYRGTIMAKLAVVSSLVLNLGLLCTFKYSGFLIRNLNAFIGTDFSIPAFSLPIGISFYTFQTISYVVDVYRGKTKAQTNPAYYLLYLSMYHQLVAGPVVRYADVAREINKRETSIVGFSEGLSRFIVGLSKKVLIANTAGSFASQYMDGDLSRLTVAGAWFGAAMFTLQIYYDFSGYSDMAIGLGRMFGFHYKENFNYPYVSRSVTEFWRRWHISLSSFFRDYVYIPLGGNRRHLFFNLLVVWFLTGLWHGASWNFIFWGLYYGLWIVLERIFLLKLLEKLPKFLQHIYLILIVLFAWVIFYFTDLQRLKTYLLAMVGIGGHPFWDFHILLALLNNIYWIGIALLFCMPVFKRMKQFVCERLSSVNISMLFYFQMPANLILLVLCTAQLVGQSYNPFLYYRF